ncbi:MAG: SigE family RNA polymerase sigma factor [Candidatus Nanopelagicales bacterium]
MQALGEAVGAAPGRQSAGPPPDEAGFRMWASLRRTSLRRSAYLMCADWHQADDLVQETLVKVYSRWRRIASKGEVDAYVRRVLVTTFLDSRRRPWRREKSYATVPDSGEDSSATAAMSAVEQTGSSPLANALALVPPRQRAVLVLRFVEDLSVEQTAALLSCSTGNVKSQTSRGLDRLRHELGVEVEDLRGHDDLGHRELLEKEEWS